MVERLLNIIFCVPNGTQYNPRDKKKEPLFRGAWRRRACLEQFPDRREGFKLEFQYLKSV
jgi:hypothetical protein